VLQELQPFLREAGRQGSICSVAIHGGKLPQLLFAAVFAPPPPTKQGKIIGTQQAYSSDVEPFS
jgi:hypothetical protein